MDVASESAPSERMGLKIGLVLVAVLIGGAVKWWFGAPDGRSSGYVAIESDRPVGCEVSHDGLLYPERKVSFDLAPSERFMGRFGPHDVTVAFLDDGERHGLQIERASRTILNSGTWGGSTGSEQRSVDVTKGFGLGTLTIACSTG